MEQQASAPVVEGRLVPAQELGVSSGLPGQRFALTERPQPQAWPMVAEVTVNEECQEWSFVESLSQSGPLDRHFTLDHATGEVVFGIQVKEASGIQQYGAVPVSGAALHMRSYLVGGGTQGNVAAGTISVLRTPLPQVSAVTNPTSCTGGADGETLLEAAERTPLGAAVPERAVVAYDYEQLARRVAAGVVQARVPTTDYEQLSPAVSTTPCRAATTTLTVSLSNPALSTIDVQLPAGSVALQPALDTRTPPVRFMTTDSVSLVRQIGLSLVQDGAQGPWVGGSVDLGAPAGFTTAIPEDLPLPDATLTFTFPAGTIDAQQPPTLTVTLHGLGPFSPSILRSQTQPQAGTDDTTILSARLGDIPGWHEAVNQVLPHTLDELFPDGAALRAQGFPQRAGAWLSCVLDTSGQPAPVIRACAYAQTASVGAIQADCVPAGASIGTATGCPGQRLSLPAWPILGDAPTVLVTAGGEFQEWTPVESFAASHPDDRHIVIDHATGEVSFGPCVNYDAINTYQHGAVPPLGATIQVGRDYLVSQGAQGNVPAGMVSQLSEEIPGLIIVNPTAATGGLDAEMALRQNPDRVHLIVVPSVAAEPDGSIDLELLDPSPELKATLTRGLARIMPPGVDLEIEPPQYQEVRVVGTIYAAADSTPEDCEALQDVAEKAMYRLFNPVHGGGPHHSGWPFGRRVHIGEAYRELQKLPDLQRIDSLSFARSAGNTVTADELTDSIDLCPLETIYSGQHEITVEIET
ncbi:baseplate J/gp47 family protein [Streptomyces sp. WZ-12]|uniref:baseplate J/gp47 family protein n=1 Tax=Streptomyces sp. WZ-12 TaxID=3030210 RepID=UPI002380EDE6|nr:baseplate J/gp47 family protein [Streptomyces sp. WZ-12]